jgi:polar amino acid transport system substrate-binding protein
MNVTAAPRGGRPRVFAAAVAVVMVTVSGGAGRAEPLRLVTGDGYEPYTGRELPGGGVFTQLVRAVYDQMGREAEIAFRPWKRGKRLTRQGRFHATFPYVRNAARRKRFVFSEPLMTLDLKPFVRAGDDRRIETHADLRGTLACLPQGWSTGSERFAEMRRDGEVEMVTVNAMTKCFQLLARERVDVVPAEVPNGKYAAREALGSLDGVRIADLVLNTSTLHVMFPKAQPDADKAAARFDAALAELRDSGRYTKIVTQPMN